MNRTEYCEQRFLHRDTENTKISLVFLCALCASVFRFQ